MLCTLILGLLACPPAHPAFWAPALPLAIRQEADTDLLAPALKPRAMTLRGQFPPGPLGALLSGLQSDSGISVTGLGSNSQWPAWDDHEAWSKDEPWDLWLSTMASLELADVATVQAAHAQLALLAHQQARPEDAWAHIARLPGQQAAGLLPGIIAGLGSAQQGQVLDFIEPILPPIPVYDASTWKALPPLREYRLEGLVSGETTFTLAVQVPPEGVEVRLVHESGPGLILNIRIPSPPDRVKRIEYVDWDRQDSEEGVNPVHRVTLLPDSDDMILWARCMPRRLSWPEVPAGSALPEQRDIEITTTPDDESLGRLQAMARAVARLLGVNVSVSLSTSGSPAGTATTGITPLRIDLSPGDLREAKLASLISQMQRHSGPFR